MLLDVRDEPRVVEPDRAERRETTRRAGDGVDEVNRGPDVADVAGDQEPEEKERRLKSPKYEQHPTTPNSQLPSPRPQPKGAARGLVLPKAERERSSAKH